MLTLSKLLRDPGQIFMLNNMEQICVVWGTEWMFLSVYVYEDWESTALWGHSALKWKLMC